MLYYKTISSHLSSLLANLESIILSAILTGLWSGHLLTSAANLNPIQASDRRHEPPPLVI